MEFEPDMGKLADTLISFSLISFKILEIYLELRPVMTAMAGFQHFFLSLSNSFSYPSMWPV
jgi:hypothetical protein